MTYEQKALEILRAIARAAADGKSLTIAHDWGFGSATIIDQAGAHTHIGDDGHDNEQRNLEAFVDGLHDVLVKGRGLSWVKPLAAAKSQTLEARAPAVLFDGFAVMLALDEKAKARTSAENVSDVLDHAGDDAAGTKRSRIGETRSSPARLDGGQP